MFVVGTSAPGKNNLLATFVVQLVWSAVVSAPDPAQYDVFAEEYEAHAAVAPYNVLYDRPATLRLVGDVEGRRVLDAACGPGFYLEALIAGGAEVVGCDAARSMIDLARARVGDQVELRVHSLDEPFTWIEEGSIDVVVCALAYHYVSNREGFLREVHRMLRPGGVLVISTHHPTADWQRLGGSYFDVATITETWSKGWEITTWRMPLTQMTEEFAAAGFVIERLIEPIPEPAMRDTHPDAFAKLSSEPGFVLFRLRPSLAGTE
ncbi:MAG TPA: class I SAM-dependent methyltransferase [Ilumatobacteraceae bacterium]|nr:class I SAM-dependent methyltransferase [Ilumatobacteraceae bacterium]